MIGAGLSGFDEIVVLIRAIIEVKKGEGKADNESKERSSKEEEGFESHGVMGNYKL